MNIGAIILLVLIASSILCAYKWIEHEEKRDA